MIATVCALLAAILMVALFPRSGIRQESMATLEQAVAAEPAAAR
jgi:hypothetical protein